MEGRGWRDGCVGEDAWNVLSAIVAGGDVCCGVWKPGGFVRVRDISNGECRLQYTHLA